MHSVSHHSVLLEAPVAADQIYRCLGFTTISRPTVLGALQVLAQFQEARFEKDLQVSVAADTPIQLDYGHEMRTTRNGQRRLLTIYKRSSAFYNFIRTRFR